MSGPFRKTDAVLTIAQDNAEQSIRVTAANEVASELIGVPLDELSGKSFKDILPDSIVGAIDDYVEFETGANDVSEVLRRVRDFQLKSAEGKSIPFRLKIVRHNSMEYDEFLLIMQDENKQRETDKFFAMLKENREGHAALVPETGLPDRSSFIKSMELVLPHRDTFGRVCMAVIELDEYEKILSKFGQDVFYKVLQGAANVCQQNLRDHDVVTQIGERRLGLLLLGAGAEPGKMVLNRLRWLIGGHETTVKQGVEAQSSATIVFRELPESGDSEELLKACEKVMDDKPESSVNTVVQAQPGA